MGKDNSPEWHCLPCLIKMHAAIFLLVMNQTQNFYELFSIELPLQLDLLPAFEIPSKSTDPPNLNSFDSEENLMHTIDSKYHSISEMNNTKCKSHSFPFSHVNVHSFTKHFEELHSLLKLTQIPFDIIGITESKQLVNTNFLTNVNIDRYKLHTQSIKSSHGGVALYVKESLNHEVRWNLSALKMTLSRSGSKSKQVIKAIYYVAVPIGIQILMLVNLLNILNQCYLNMTSQA